jgi:DNA polymerase
VNPELIVCLGASAAQAVLGRKIKISEERGRTLVRGKARVIVTYHPSAILRVPDEAEQTRLLAALVEDLRGASMSLAAVSKSAS